jgi:hypothetical protein
MPNTYILVPNDELCHYGVKGMKWGVRRDARIIANHRYNQARKYIKDERRLGEIDSTQKKSKIRDAKLERKKFMTDVEDSYRNAKTANEIQRLDKKISKMALKEVPNIKVKRGAAMIDRINSTLAVAGTSLAGITMTALTAASGASLPAVIGTAIGGMVAAPAIDIADNKLRGKVIDRFS